MTIALLTLSVPGLAVAEQIRAGFPFANVYAHESLTLPPGPRRVQPFAKIAELTLRIFHRYEGLVYIAPCGVAVRAIAGSLTDKHNDPAVVVVDVGARFAVSLLSGHEGGANALALTIANLIGAEPVVSTTTEAVKNIIVGVGCRKGVAADKVKAAIAASLDHVGAAIEAVRFIATADVKAGEAGLIQAAAELDVPLRIIPSQSIVAYAGAFKTSRFVMQTVNLPAVAEPAAMLAGRRTQLIHEKRNYNGITVAVARENSMSLASVRGPNQTER